MSPMESQITGVPIVCTTVCSGADHRKHQSSASLTFVRGIHRWPVNSPHTGPVARKIFPFDDVIMSFCPATIRTPLGGRSTYHHMDINHREVHLSITRAIMSTNHSSLDIHWECLSVTMIEYIDTFQPPSPMSSPYCVCHASFTQPSACYKRQWTLC